MRCAQGERPKKKFERGQFERRARMERDALESLLFRLFERQVIFFCFGACSS